jgi:hypothetical protein
MFFKERELVPVLDEGMKTTHNSEGRRVMPGSR